MFRKVILPMLAVMGVLLAVWTVIVGNRQPAAAQPVTPPSEAPFDAYVAGAGLLEASTENIAIGTPVGNVVSEVLARVGERVSKGDVLFRLHDPVVLADVEVRRSALAVAAARLERLRQLPRPEDVPPAEATVQAAHAAVAEAQSALQDAQAQFALWERARAENPRAVSVQDYDRRKYAVAGAQTRLAAAQSKLRAAEAELALLKAGSWEYEITEAEAEVAQARAAVKQGEAEIERRSIRAPVDGTVLQVKVRAGEYAQAGPLATPLMMIGDVDTLHVRVDVDENDAWRIDTDPPARAVAYVRGNPSLRTELKFVRVEPYVVPKRSLTGESTERVDTRVLQVVYAFDRAALPVYAGQQMDVFIEARPVTDGK